ncbi:MAG: ribosomal protein L7/L12 [Vicinamibacterales bacterium]
MSGFSEYLTSMGISPLVAGLVIGFLVGLVVRGGGSARPSGPPATATLGAAFGGSRITVTVDGVSRELSASQTQAVLDALGRNRKIEAIKALREGTGIGLKDAKDAVESLQATRATLNG